MLDRIREIISNILSDSKIELVDITYRREGNTKVLRILADKENGITIDECAKMNEMELCFSPTGRLRNICTRSPRLLALGWRLIVACSVCSG